MSRQKLSADQIDEALTKLTDWEVRDGKFYKVFEFDSFAQALGWMVSVGVEADKLDHHPDWSNSYNKVTVELMTHSLGALSELDVQLAQKMDSHYEGH